MATAHLDKPIKARRSIAGSGGAAPSWPSFEAEIERSLRLLRPIRLPVTLFALKFPADAAADRAAVDALSGLGAVGRLPDGRLGLFYLGPRTAGESGEAALVKLVYERAARAFAAQGCGAEALQVAAAHAWTDALTSAAFFAALLTVSPQARKQGRELALASLLSADYLPHPA